MKKKIYISGKITGLPNEYTRERFAAAEAYLKLFGFDVVNPFEMCAKLPGPGPWEEYMKADIAELVKCAGVYMLKNWEDSRGARLEFLIASELDIKVYFEGGGAL